MYNLYYFKIQLKTIQVTILYDMGVLCFGIVVYSCADLLRTRYHQSKKDPNKKDPDLKSFFLVISQYYQDKTILWDGVSSHK